MTTEIKRVRYSAKAMTIHQLNVLINHFKELDKVNDFQVLLLTPFGFIKGDLEEVSDTEQFITAVENAPNSYKFDLSYLIKLRNETISDLEDEINVIDNAATLNFRNVEIYHNNLSEPIATLEQMLVFADQIISFSIVPRQND